jgi:hypothetical protein
METVAYDCRKKSSSQTTTLWTYIMKRAMGIRVISKRKGGSKALPGEIVVYIGRPSTLENTFEMAKEADRKSVITQFKEKLILDYRQKGAVYRELNRLSELVRNGSELALECWCAPLKCHGDVLKAAIEGINRKVQP